MDVLTILKLTPSLVRFTGDAMMYFGSRYALRCEADEFKSDTTSPAALSLETASRTLASCALEPDPQRRGVRTGLLSLASLSGAEGRYWLCAKLDGDVVFRSEVLVFAPAGSSAPDAEPDGRWTVRELGTVTSASVSVADMEQVRLVSAPSSDPLSVSAPTGPFEAYVVVDSPSGGFPFPSVLVNGRTPVWEHMDSLLLPSTVWTLHLVSVAGFMRAELHADVAAGAENDPDGDLVSSMEVNS